jgi:hypothetical protein
MSEEDNWKHRSEGMRCRTCMFYVIKAKTAIVKGDTPTSIKKIKKNVGRCRRHAPTMNGFPVVYDDDWCGDHKIDEDKV